MAQQCPSCSSKRVKVQDSHYSYISPDRRKAVKYYKCKECKKEFTVEE